jgi:HlyD family secretion protein
MDRYRIAIACGFGAAITAAVLLLVVLALSRPAPHPAAHVESTERAWEAVAPGRVEPSSGETKITPLAVGVVSDVLVKPGDTVSPGEPLIKLQDEEIQARLAAAEAQVNLRQRARNDQHANGRAADRRKAEDEVADAETQVYNARQSFDAVDEAHRLHGVPDVAVTTARDALDRAQQQLKSRNDVLKQVDADSPLPAEADGMLSVARAELAQTRAAADKLVIRAPIPGTVLQVHARIGETASPQASAPLLVIGNISSLRVRAELDDRDVGGIKVGQSVVVRAAPFPGRDFPGKVASIAPIVAPAGTLPRGPGQLTDVDVVEVLIDLSDPGPLASGTKVDAYFGRPEP